MACAMLAMPLMDVGGKYLTLYEGVSPGTNTFFRFLVQMILTGVVIVAFDGAAALRPNQLLLNLLRGVLLAAASGVFLIAIKYVPLADALAIFFVEPFILTAMSAVFLREQVGWRRWLAIIVGFSGALLVIRPNFLEFGAVSLLPLLTATTFASYLLLNKVLSARDNSMVMQSSAGLGGCLFAAAILVFGSVAGVDDLAWTPPASALAVAVLIGVGVVSSFGHLLIVSAFRLAPASLLAPFQYFEIVSGAVLGYIVFNEFPEFIEWIGVAIIVASGLYILYRERQLAIAGRK